MNKVGIIALLGLSLIGCNEYPGHRPNDGVKMTAKPIWGNSIGREIPLGGDCHIDTVNNELAEGTLSHTVKGSGPALKVTGWGAISVKDGVIASDIAIALKSKSAQGTRLFATATKEKRQDVADYFKNPASVDTGFIAAIDLSDVPPGEYVLEVIQHKDGKNIKCQYTSNIIIKK